MSEPVPQFHVTYGSNAADRSPSSALPAEPVAKPEDKSLISAAIGDLTSYLPSRPPMEETKEAGIVVEARAAELARLTSGDVRFEKWRTDARERAEKLFAGGHYTEETKLLMSRGKSAEDVSSPRDAPRKPQGGGGGEAAMGGVLRPYCSIHGSLRPKNSRSGSIEIKLEKTMATHRHEIVQPRQSETVSGSLARTRKMKMLLAISAFGLVITCSCLFFTLAAGMPLVDAFYFSVVTMTTTGYGDISPQTRTEQCASLLLFLLGAGIVGSYISDAFATLLEESRKKGGQEKPYMQLGRNLTVLVAWMVAGAVCFMLIESDKSLSESIYWSGATLLTVGYGDVAPRTRSGKVFTACFLLGGTSICLQALGSIAAIPLETHRSELRKKILQQYGDVLTQAEFLELTRGEIVRKLDLVEVSHGGERRCSKTAFAIEMLVKLGKCEYDDVRACIEQFERLDKAHRGYLVFDDVFGDKKSLRRKSVSRLSLVQETHRRASSSNSNSDDDGEGDDSSSDSSETTHYVDHHSASADSSYGGGNLHHHHRDSSSNEKEKKNRDSRSPLRRRSLDTASSSLSSSNEPRDSASPTRVPTAVHFKGTTPISGASPLISPRVVDTAGHPSAPTTRLRNNPSSSSNNKSAVVSSSDRASSSSSSSSSSYSSVAARKPSPPSAQSSSSSYPSTAMTPLHKHPAQWVASSDRATTSSVRGSSSSSSSSIDPSPSSTLRSPVPSSRVRFAPKTNDGAPHVV